MVYTRFSHPSLFSYPLHPLYRGESPPVYGVLGKLLAGFGAEVVVGHPTFRNADNIGAELRQGIRAAVEVYAGQKAAFIVSDGTFRKDDPDTSTLEAALSGAKAVVDELPEEARGNLLVAAIPYEGYREDRTPGKGSALKLIFDELAFVPALRKLILLDGDLRNEMKPWFRVFRRVEAEHREHAGDRRFFVTARYARHFVDASLTRFIVGPLTTLMGQYVPGGISGDIVLSAGAVQHERDAHWDEHRRRYGTDIATTFDNIADPQTDIYEVYLGAKLHDITDEAKLSVMPGEVIGSALGRILYYEEQDGRVTQRIRKNLPLERPRTWGPEKTEIAFIDPGYTSVFNVDAKRATLVEKFPYHKEAVQAVLQPDLFHRVQKAWTRLGNLPVRDEDPFEFMHLTRDVWIEILYQSIGYLLKNRDVETTKQCLNYLYTAAFLEFCREKIVFLGGKTFGDVRRLQASLGVPPEAAERFYRCEVDEVVERMAMDFYTERRKILSENLS